MVWQDVAKEQGLEIKEGFIERYSKLTDFEAFMQSNMTYLRRSIRVNTLKSTVADVKKRLALQGWTCTQIPWCNEGFWVKHNEGRLDIGSTVEHMLGYYYVQEAASMIPPLVLDIEPGQTVLDLCAAPGSKTSQIAMMMEGKGALIANDVSGDRLAPLGLNLQRCGVTNSVITLMQGKDFAKLGPVFDRVLVDAPCSGTGTIRKSYKTFKIWNVHMLKKIVREQERLLDVGYSVCKPGGVVVYSTCSLEPEEDEGVISNFLAKHPEATLEKVSLPGLHHKPALDHFEDAIYHESVPSHVLRIWPQENDTEGFFVAKIRKP